MYLERISDNNNNNNISQNIHSKHLLSCVFHLMKCNYSLTYCLYIAIKFGTWPNVINYKILVYVSFFSGVVH